MNTKQLIEKANQLRLVLIERAAEEKRYWDKYEDLAQARETATSQEAWLAATAAYKQHRGSPAPYSRDLIAAWHEALRVAKNAVAADAGLELEAV